MQEPTAPGSANVQAMSQPLHGNEAVEGSLSSHATGSGSPETRPNANGNQGDLTLHSLPRTCLQGVAPEV